MFRKTAHLYDLIYEAQGKDYGAESAEVSSLIRERNPQATLLLDVACGTGGHLAHLRQWYEVEGLDADAGMLAQARSRLGDVPLHEADMRSFALGRRFDAVICLFSSIGYMESADELDRAIFNMADHLGPRGVLIVDGWVRPDQWREPGTTHVETAKDEEMTVVRASRSRREGKATHLEMHHLVVTLDGIEHLVDHHVLSLFTPAEYEAAITKAGLRFQVTASPMAGRDRYVATKPT